MGKVNLLGNYPSPKKKRYVSENLRTIKHRIVASYRSKEFYDGKRIYGMGGFRYDGRWKPIAEKICKKYKLNKKSKILEISCKKGFLMNDLKKTIPKMKVVGLESSQYAINHSLKSVRKNIKKISSYSKLNFKTNSFDFVIALGVVYEQDLSGAIALLKEIQRVSKGKSFVTLGSYKTLKEFIQLRQWTLLGTIILKESEWKQVLKHVKYSGDYDLVNAKNLSLVSKR